MKALSLWQPWASLIAFGLKTYETRNWRTSYRGELVICSAKKNTKDLKNFYETQLPMEAHHPTWKQLPFGCTVALVELTHCILITDEFINQQTRAEIACGDWKPGRYAHKYENIRELVNTHVIGRQGFFELDFEPFIKLDLK